MPIGGFVITCAPADRAIVTSHLKTIASVLSVGLAYLNAEDEIGRIASGELRPDPFGRKKRS